MDVGFTAELLTSYESTGHHYQITLLLQFFFKYLFPVTNTKKYPISWV